jgi:predicted PurR-regulated permease PerM
MQDLRRLLGRLVGMDRGPFGAGSTHKPAGSLADGVAADPTPVPSVPPAPAAVVIRHDRGPFALLLLAVVAVLWLSRAVLGPFIVAGVIAYAFSPLVSSTQRRMGWPRVVVVAVGYVCAIAVIAVVVGLLAGRIASELHLLAAGGPDALATTLRHMVGGDSVQIGNQTILMADVAREIQSRFLGLVSSPGDTLHVVGQVGEFGLQTILTIIISFYLLVDGDLFMDRTIALLPGTHRARTVDVLARIHIVLGKWLRGQILLIALVAAVAYIGLGPILHLPYALGLAILTGILEIIPLVGPLIATAVVAIDAFARGGPGLAAVVIVFYFVLRQVEDQVVMPIVIGRAVHLHPVVTIFAVLVGLSLYGVLGGLLGVPVAAAANVVFRELYPSESSPPGEDPGGRPVDVPATAG